MLSKSSILVRHKCTKPILVKKICEDLQKKRGCAVFSMLFILSDMSGTVQAYQIATSGALPQGVVMATTGSAMSSPQNLSEEASRKRELRLLKNRSVCYTNTLPQGLSGAAEIIPNTNTLPQGLSGAGELFKTQIDLLQGLFCGTFLKKKSGALGYEIG